MSYLGGGSIDSVDRMQLYHPFHPVVGVERQK